MSPSTLRRCPALWYLWLWFSFWNRWWNWKSFWCKGYKMYPLLFYRTIENKAAKPNSFSHSILCSDHHLWSQVLYSNRGNKILDTRKPRWVFSTGWLAWPSMTACESERASGSDCNSFTLIRADEVNHGPGKYTLWDCCFGRPPPEQNQATLEGVQLPAGLGVCKDSQGVAERSFCCLLDTNQDKTVDGSMEDFTCCYWAK